MLYCLLPGSHPQVKVTQVENAFSTVTFPNHWTIVTGAPSLGSLAWKGGPLAW